jgi:hypothetical protein
MRSRFVTWAVVVVGAWAVSPRPCCGQRSPSELIARVVAGQQTRGYTLRARLVTSVRGREAPSTVQVRALGWRRDGTARTLYQALWPAAVKGRAVSFESEAGRFVSGLLFQPPDTVTPLSEDLLGTPLFDSELTAEDLVEDFWSWPAPSGTAPGVVNGQSCQVVELRPPAGTRSAYALVRACISDAKALPLLVEKLDGEGRTVRRFRVEKAVKRDGRWAPARLAIEDPVRQRTTMVEVTRGERDLVVALAEFSVARIKSFGAADRARPGR